MAGNFVILSNLILHVNFTDIQKMTIKKYRLCLAKWEDLLSEVSDNSIDAIITDPPYGYLSHKIEANPIDTLSFSTEMYRVLKHGGFFAFFGKDPMMTFWNLHAMEAGFKHKDTIIWHKRQPSSPLGDIGHCHERISIFTKSNKSKKAVRFNNERFSVQQHYVSFADWIKLNTVNATIKKLKSIEKSKTKILTIVEGMLSKNGVVYNGPKKNNDFASLSTEVKRRKDEDTYEYRRATFGMNPMDIVSIMPHNKQRFSADGKGRYNVKHPTVKPIQLIEWLIKLMSKPGDKILDPFIGSGTTIISGLRTERFVIGCEILPEFFSLAEERVKDYLLNPNMFK